MRSPFLAANVFTCRQYIQLLVIPVAFTFGGFIGIAVTSVGATLYGKVLWNPLTLIDHWDNRPAAFFAAFSFALATLGTNVSANTISAANDMTVLFPRYINIKRGQIITAVIAPWAFVPWDIVSTAQGFLSFMNGYTVFLGPFAAIMVADVSASNMHANRQDADVVVSIGSCIAARWMSRRCIARMDATAIPAAL